MSREIMQQALTALRISTPFAHALEYYEFRNKAIKDIEAELAKPEPFDWASFWHKQYERAAENATFMGEQLKYVVEYNQTLKAKKPWQGLTDEEIKGILDCGRGGLVDIKKAEQILKEKNGG